jgi:trehalose 6-phosphate phosphatase
LQNSNRLEVAACEEVLAYDPAGCALFLDVDGTLLDIALTPAQVVVPPGLVELLLRVAQGLGGAVAILTGRQLAEIDTLLAPAKFAGAGVQGAELRRVAAGPIERVATPLPQALVDSLAALAERLPGAVIEPKGPGIAVHYRAAPELKPVVEAEIRALLTQYPDELVICPGRKLFEIVPEGLSKGTALETLAALPPFAGRRPVMIGDDAGDVPALTAAVRLGGFGLRVAGGHFGRANVDLEGPAGVAAWLERLARRLKV